MIQDKKKNKGMQLSEYANSLIIDMKSLSNLLKPLSKNLYENNNRVLNEVLTGKQQDINQLIIRVLSHSLQIAQYKPLVAHILQVLKKTILCLKTFPPCSCPSTAFSEHEQMVLCLVDTLLAITNQNCDNQETSLRVLQVTFSLNDQCLVQYFNASIVVRMFSVCFQFCTGGTTAQTISVSALSALMEVMFQYGQQKQCFAVLREMLEYLFEGKKFVWVKGKDVRGLVWDLIVIAVKNFSTNHIISLDKYPQCLKQLTKMYQLSLQNIFQKKSKSFYTPTTPQRQPKPQNNPSSSLSSLSTSSSTTPSDIYTFIRHFKSYVSLSTTLSLLSYAAIQKEYVPFRSTIPKLGIVCDLERNSRMYIFLEAICQLLLTQYDLPLALEKGVIFMEVLSKVSEELCWCNEVGVTVNWDSNQTYLHKVVNEEPKIGDGDFVRLIKNTIFNLRTKFEKDQDLISCKKQKVGESSRSSIALPQNLGNSKRWQSFIKNVVRIIRYLSSLNFVTEQTEQDPTRKIILQLQYWFLLCPIAKAKNMILQQLLITANVLNNRMQAIKVSQSVQIGSNILYGYYDDLDSTGLTIVLKMMAGIKADWEDGKSFEELDQVYNLVNNIYNEEQLINSQSSFLMTIQALVQCTNSLIADIEQPKQKPQPTSTGNATSPLPSAHPIKRFHKMIDFLLQKLITVINNHLSLAAFQWNFITGFLITLCINKNLKIKEDGVKAIGALVTRLLKSELGKELDQKKQRDILGLYEELSKSKMQKDIELAVIDQLKGIMPRIKQQNALMDGFRIVKILSDSQSKNTEVIANIHELQQILIKDCLYKITQVKYLKLILQGIQIKSSQKNQEYRLINLLWAISDYFRKITPPSNIPNQYLELWELLFKNIWIICEKSREFQTKQSAIHCTTQILGEVLSLLPFEFIVVLIARYYKDMVLLLLGVHESSLPENQKSSETAKVALKNYIKLFKKLISIENKSEQDKKQITKNFSSINKNITKFIQSHIESKTTGSITLELLYELCNFILVVSEDAGFGDYNVKGDLWAMLISIEDLIKLCETGVSGGKMDLKSHMYKKKLKPLMEKIREIHDKEKKDEVVINADQKPNGE